MASPWLRPTDNQIRHQGWRIENALFSREILTVDYLRVGLARATARLSGVIESPIPARMAADFPAQRRLLAHRPRVLPDIVSRSLDATNDWPPQ